MMSWAGDKLQLASGDSRVELDVYSGISSTDAFCFTIGLWVIGRGCDMLFVIIFAESVEFS